MNVTIESSGNLVIAYLYGDIDHHTAVDIRDKIDNALSFIKPQHLILDFKNVAFMDSSGIGLVMGRYKKAREVGAELHITNTSPQIYKVMRLSGIERLAVIDKGGYKNEIGK